ncbi:MAG: HAD family phosphatase [Oscillospiraceae bacterium]|nr:HAD family phosphatase [Oscillospiraceae bacterium]
MIKLIATDMDGTLLAPGGKLHPDFFPLLEELRRRGVHFLAASGRYYASLQRNFEPRPDLLDYICDNGACLVENGKVIAEHPLTPEQVTGIIDVCADLPGVRVQPCGSRGAYHAANEPEYGVEGAEKIIYPSMREDFAGIDDMIYKFSLMDLNDPYQNSIRALKERFGDSLTILLSGTRWIDVMNAGVDKGKGLAFFQQRWGIAPEETMAFGDYFNDVSLFEHAYYSFAMENGHPDIRKHARFVAPPNTEHGVVQMIRKYVLEE